MDAAWPGEGSKLQNFEWKLLLKETVFFDNIMYGGQQNALSHLKCK